MAIAFKEVLFNNTTPKKRASPKVTVKNKLFSTDELIKYYQDEEQKAIELKKQKELKKEEKLEKKSKREEDNLVKQELKKRRKTLSDEKKKQKELAKLSKTCCECKQVHR